MPPPEPPVPAPPPPALDRAAVARHFARAAPRFDEATGPFAGVREELLSRIGYFGLDPRVVLDLGAGTGPASRAYLLVQNQAATESCYMMTGTTATPGLGIEIQAGDSVLRPWGTSVKCAVVSTDSINIVVEHGVMP